jgi:uncharacterized protein (DUF58 family)
LELLQEGTARPGRLGHLVLGVLLLLVLGVLFLLVLGFLLLLTLGVLLLFLFFFIAYRATRSDLAATAQVAVRFVRRRGRGRGRGVVRLDNVVEAHALLLEA